VLGEPWREAGVYTQILVPWIAIVAVGSPLSSIFLAKKRLGENFAFNVVLLVARVAGLVTGGLLVGPRTGIGLFVVASVLIWLLLIARALKLAGASRRQAAGILVAAYGEALVLLVPAGVFYWGFDWKLASLIALGLACLVYVAILRRRHPQAFAVFRSMFDRLRGTAEA